MLKNGTYHVIIQTGAILTPANIESNGEEATVVDPSLFHLKSKTFMFHGT